MLIDIVLATFNGEKFLEEQLISIQKNHDYAQLVRNIIVVDDGSTDTTLKIIQSYQKNDQRIILHRSQGKSLGASGNFNRGLLLTTAPYIMLADQDDVWFTDKITKSLTLLQRIEAESVRTENPTLVFSDLHIVDAELGLICPSYFTLKKIPKSWHQDVNNLLQQNVMSGCTMMFNRALLTKALPIPENAYMHDWWLGIVASCFGNVELLDQPTMAYRQHDNNAIGASVITWYTSALFFKAKLFKFKVSTIAVIKQARCFVDYYNLKHQMDLPSSLLPLANLEQLTRLQRLKLVNSGVIKRSNWRGNLALMIVLFLFSLS